MGWLVAYLVSILVVPTIVAAIMVNDGPTSFDMNNSGDVFSSWAICVFWPISFVVLLIVGFMEARKNYYTKHSTETMRKYNIDAISTQDRSGILVVPEAELKFLLKACRKNHIKLTPKTIEIVRDELMHRNAEKNLLK